mmetsp:Transcript_32493/g.39992  ORF Transcript_32493/g.39992 Transcript_32493/m.39992 type:complete len:245 (-) Transcript_32493:240-974(-)|eukprot:CAMPEP_0204830128 /NCGR_PEP_ID=MMETSP1346-20131115/8352_1 /ASSEMBLY_ACC=CAM_ASM_000771 /TAXON_ID=215587 /ORGANISM="Aplanochytrium stocchinoi, Strain GSBS06" /LENGTH=244 /DNA_ID=CAMNT_0051960265 /DNA_START=114 /DNA_END=848 /DNA_ORIENTATION=-
MRVLALHGRYQSAKIFARKLAAAQDIPLENAVWTQCGDEAGEVTLNIVNENAANAPIRIVCLDAPNIVKPKIRMKKATVRLKNNEDKHGKRCISRAWWEIEKGNERPVGYEESISHIRKVLHEHGPFDGLFGFSQGACLAALLCTNALAEQMKWKPEFALLCSAYSSSLTCHQDLVYSGYVHHLKSIHLFSMNDCMVLPRKSQELCENMKGVCITHEKGHSLPSKEEFSKLDWLFNNTVETVEK